MARARPQLRDPVEAAAKGVSDLAPFPRMCFVIADLSHMLTYIKN